MAKKKVSTKATQTTVRVPTTFEDVKTAVLVVSLVINLAVFIAWLILRITSKYDEQVYQFLFTR
jgi:hypothetical protein